jgi:hypothetical protein
MERRCLRSIPEKKHYTGEIIEVNLKSKSPSIAIENDSVKFEVDTEKVQVSQPHIHIITLFCDQFALFEPKPFKIGDYWDITLSDSNEFVFLFPSHIP